MNEIIKSFLFRYRIKKAISYWKNHLDYIKNDLKENQRDEYDMFRWTDLVWQEIRMFCSIGKQVIPADIKWLVGRRGFNNNQELFLVSCTKEMGLGKKLI